jgi:Xaa-Pro dipeptidase
MIEKHYSGHVSERRKKTEAALAATGFDALVLSSGRPFVYFADDASPPHRPTPHFAHWLPLAGPQHLLLVRPGQRPRLVHFAPEDYWYEQAPLDHPFWATEYEIAEVGAAERAWSELELPRRTAYVGDDPAAARAAGIAEAAQNPPELVARLDWDRSYKTPYEVACLEAATRAAAPGHRAARAAFEGGASELAIHQAYVQALGCTDADLPYASIVALDEKGATLHYEKKRTQGNGRVLLIDVGAKHLGYGCDITRTWTARDCPAAFVELVRGLDALQQELCARVRPGLAYGELHHQAHVAIADLLAAIGVLQRGGEQAVAHGLTRPFFPHGLGHFLGIQVHDVAGHQAAPQGGRVPPPAQYPYLRTTRTIEPDMVFTIEPGVYFIELLLREHRDGEHAGAFDWGLIERLMPCGGVRIEDNVVVTANGHRNLTRPWI